MFRQYIKKLVIISLVSLHLGSKPLQGDCKVRQCNITSSSVPTKAHYIFQPGSNRRRQKCATLALAYIEQIFPAMIISTDFTTVLENGNKPQVTCLGGPPLEKYFEVALRNLNLCFDRRLKI